MQAISELNVLKKEDTDFYIFLSVLKEQGWNNEYRSPL